MNIVKALQRVVDFVRTSTNEQRNRRRRTILEQKWQRLLRFGLGWIFIGVNFLHPAEAAFDPTVYEWAVEWSTTIYRPTRPEACAALKEVLDNDDLLISTRM